MNQQAQTANLELIERTNYDRRNIQRVNFLSKFIKPGLLGAELGVYKGWFSKLILSELKPSQLYLIDPWYLQGKDWCWSPGNPRKIDALTGILYELEEYLVSKKAVLIIDDDLTALSKLPDEHLDWVYLDTTHDFQQSVKELKILRRKVKAGGFITGDDWRRDPLHKHHGVYRAVQDFLRTESCELVGLDEPLLQWAIKLS